MKIKISIIILFAVIIITACNKSLLDKVDPNRVTPEGFYSNADELTQGVNAIYSIVQGANLAAREWFYIHDTRSDDMASGGSQLEAPRYQLLTGNQTSANSVMLAVWQGLYRTIHRANTVVDAAPQTKSIDPALRLRFISEAKFLRSWANFDLVTLWGSVPLYKTHVLTLEGAQPKAKTDSIYAFIIQNLLEAQNGLPATYTNQNDLGRATKGAAQALLGRVYMQKGDYASAKIQLDAVRTSGNYSLMNNYVDNFSEETGFNAESIFEVAFYGTNFLWGGGSSDGNGVSGKATTRTQEYSAVGWRNLIPSDSLLANFERVTKGDAKNDPRFKYNFYRSGDTIVNNTATLDTSKVLGNTSNFEGKKEKISWRKYTSLYKIGSTGYFGPMNLRIIRYADVLLMLAECENELGNISTAVGYLNQVRARPSVNMPPYPTVNYPVGNKNQVLRAIIHEKRVELAGEEIRNRDILRWRSQGKITYEPITYFQKNKHELLPIPQDEISTNPKLTNADQNPGY